MTHHTDIRLSDKRLGTIEPELFGCLIENYGTLLDGIWVGDDAETPNDAGLRLDTIAALRELGIGTIRFPGGTPADHYRWRDGIGPRDQRPRTWNFFFGGEETNEFGTDEFVRLCEKVGAAPSIKLNPISGTLHDALEWMQYCNHNGNTDLANERRANGHPEPFGVKSWIIGNETADAWSPEGYAELVFRWTFFMRQLDPAARIIAEGWNADWNERFLKRFSQLSKAGGVISNDVASASAQGMDIQPGGKLHMLGLKYPKEEDLRDTIAMIDEYFDGGLELCVEEWEGQTRFTCGWPEQWLETMSVFEIVLHQGRATLTYENEATLEGALKVAERMHAWMRCAEHVKMATYLYPTNTWAPLIVTRGADLVRTPHYYAMSMLSAHRTAKGVGVEGGAGGIDAVASLADNRLTVSLLNKHADQAAETTVHVDLVGHPVANSVTATVLTGDRGAENGFDSPDRIVPMESNVRVADGSLGIPCPPASLTVVQCDMDL